MSSVQGITLPQLPVASSVQGTDLTYICNPSGNPSDLQATMSSVATYVASALLENNTNATVNNTSTFSTQAIITLLKSIQPKIGEIKYCAQAISSNWLLCNGATYQISQYPDLYTILGTSFGGDGVTTFGVPNLKGRMVMATGTASSGGTTNRFFGSYYGAETSTLTSSNLPRGTATGSGSIYGAVQVSSASTPSSGVPVVPPVCVVGDFYIFAKNIF